MFDLTCCFTTVSRVFKKKNNQIDMLMQLADVTSERV